MGYWQPITQNCINQILDMTWKWWQWQKTENGTEWPKCTTFWRGTGQPISMCYTDRNLHSKHTNTSHGLHLEYRRDRFGSESNVQHHGIAACNWSEQSPLPPQLGTKELTGWGRLVFNIRQIKRFNSHQCTSEQDSVPEWLMDMEHSLDLNWDWDNPNSSDNDWKAGTESNTVLVNVFNIPEFIEKREVNAVPNVPGLIWPIWRWDGKDEIVLMLVNTIEMRSHHGNTTMWCQMRQFILTRCLRSFEWAGYIQ